MDRETMGCALKGAGIGLLTALCLLFLTSFLAQKAQDPDPILQILPHVIRTLAGCAAGFAASRMKGEKGLVTGASAGAILAACLALGAAVFGGSFRLLPAILLCLGVIGAGALGGFFGLPRAKNGAARRRAMKKRFG